MVNYDTTTQYINFNWTIFDAIDNNMCSIFYTHHNKTDNSVELM